MLPLQKELCPELPPVAGNRDVKELRLLLERVDELLVQSGVEEEFVLGFPVSRRDTPKKVGRLVRALRCTVLRMLFQLPYKRAARELGTNYLYQKFCGLVRVDVIDSPSSSTLERYEKLVSAQLLGRLIARLNGVAAQPAGLPAERDLALEKPLELGAVYVDSTAFKARVHYPVDWLLLRDATRTLVLAIEQARKRGIRSRMPEKPKAYLRKMNKLCIEMTHARRTKESVKVRKRVFRRMKKLMRTVEGLAQGHVEKLRKQGPSKGIGVLTLQAIEGKFTAVLGQVDAIIHQAHERIIGGRRVGNKDKILSLYEPDMHVIVRGKTGAEVEFGNTLFLAEQADGLIVDWRLYKEQAPADSKMVPGHIARVKEHGGIGLASLTGDRGFDSKANGEALAKEEIGNYLCPRNIDELRKRLGEGEFQKHQTRRAQTEARIAILTRNFTGSPARKWGHPNKERLCAWAILAHNLWVLARLPRLQESPARAA
jgi:hypothetical protein